MEGAEPVGAQSALDFVAEAEEVGADATHAASSDPCAARQGGADATLRRMESDATFRERGPTTGAADLARLAHELMHSPCYHGKRVYHARRAETGLANRFALDLVPGKKGADDPHNVPGKLAKWQEEILGAMYNHWSPNQNWENRGIANKWYPTTQFSNRRFADRKWGSEEAVWRTSDDKGAPVNLMLTEPVYPWAMNKAAPANVNTSDLRLTKQDMRLIMVKSETVPPSVINYLRDQLRIRRYKVPGFSETMPLLNEKEIEAICGAVREVDSGYVLAGWRERNKDGTLFSPDDLDHKESQQNMKDLTDADKTEKIMHNAAYWVSQRESNQIVDSWWDSLLLWVDERGPLGALLNGANGGTSGRPALLNTLTAVMDGTLKLPGPGSVLPTPPAPVVAQQTQPPAPGTTPDALVTLTLNVNPYGAPLAPPRKPPEKYPVNELNDSMDAVSRSRSRFAWSRQVHIEIPGGYYVGQVEARDQTVVDADGDLFLEDATVIPAGHGHAIYGYRTQLSGNSAAVFSEHRLANNGVAWGVKPHGDLSLLHPGDEYTGLWKNGLRHDDGGQYLFGTSTMLYKDGSKYVGMWSNGKPHGIGSFYSCDGWKYTGKFEDGFRVTEIGTYFTPMERWSRKGRRGFFPADYLKFVLCEDWALKLADEDHSETYRTALLTMDGEPEPPDEDPENNKAGKEYHGGPVAAARRVVVEGVNYPTLQGNKFRNRVLLRFASTKTLNVIKEAFKVTCPSDLGCGRDVTGYLADDWSRRYHQIKPIAVYTVDYTYHQRVSDAYRRCVFRVRDNRSRWLEVESRWRTANSERLAQQTANSIPKWIAKADLGGTSQASLSYGRFHVDPAPQYLAYPGPRTHKFPIFLATKENPEGTGIVVAADDPSKEAVVSIMTPDQKGDGAPGAVGYRPPKDFAEAVGPNGELTSQVVTRTDTLFGWDGARLLDPVDKYGFRIETVSSEDPLDLAVNEKLLFHGTASAFVERIVANGFDGFMAGAGIYGTVNYFAEDPGKADQYGRLSRKNKTGHFCGAQTSHYDLRLRQRLGISDKDLDDAVVSKESGLDDNGAKDVFYMFVARVCLGTPMLVDEDATVYENTAGNMGSWESMHVKEHFAMDETQATTLATKVVATVERSEPFKEMGLASYGLEMTGAIRRVMLRTAENVLKRNPTKQAATTAVEEMVREWRQVLNKYPGSDNDKRAKRCEESVVEKFLDDPVQGGEPRGNGLFPWNDQPMPFWVQAMFRTPGSNKPSKMTYRNTTGSSNMHVDHTEAPTIPASVQARKEWRSDKSGNNLSLNLWVSKIEALHNQRALLEQQCKFNNAYDSAIGFGWGTRCGQESYRMRYREFCLARSDPNHPTEIAARPTHLVAYKRIATWPTHYPVNGFVANSNNYMYDKPSNWGAKWVKKYDMAWDKPDGLETKKGEETHVNGPITATESYPRIEKINGGIAYT